MIANPWHNLPPESPFVLPEDRDQVLAFNAKTLRKKNQNHFLQLDFIPEPYVGNPEAPILLLGHNPGFKSSEAAAFRLKPQFAARMRSNLVHQLSVDYPFLYLDPEIVPPSHRWWERKLKRLLLEFQSRDNAVSVLSRSILAVEAFPYVSHRFRHGMLKLTSQEYSFDLVRNAMKRDAVIIVTRGEKRWANAVQGLEVYPHLVRLKQVQSAPISPGNCAGDGYQKIVQKIRTIS